MTENEIRRQATKLLDDLNALNAMSQSGGDRPLPREVRELRRIYDKTAELCDVVGWSL